MMNKKGSLSLSINAVIVIVIAFVFLGLGLNFIRTQLGGAGDTATMVQEQIKQDIADNKIVVFMKGDKEQPQCGFSAAVMDVFGQLGVEFTTRNVLANEELRQGIKEFSNWPTIPQVYVDSEFVGGCDIVLEMFRNGELKELVSKSE